MNLDPFTENRISNYQVKGQDKLEVHDIPGNKMIPKLNKELNQKLV